MNATCCLNMAFAFFLTVVLHSTASDEELQTVLKKYGGWEDVTSSGNIAAMSFKERNILIESYRGRIEAIGRKYKDDLFKAGAETRVLFHELRKLGDSEALAETAPRRMDILMKEDSTKKPSTESLFSPLTSPIIITKEEIAAASAELDAERKADEKAGRRVKLKVPTIFHSE